MQTNEKDTVTTGKVATHKRISFLAQTGVKMPVSEAEGALLDTLRAAIASETDPIAHADFSAWQLLKLATGAALEGEPILPLDMQAQPLLYLAAYSVAEWIKANRKDATEEETAPAPISAPIPAPYVIGLGISNPSQPAPVAEPAEAEDRDKNGHRFFDNVLDLSEPQGKMVETLMEWTDAQTNPELRRELAQWDAARCYVDRYRNGDFDMADAISVMGEERAPEFLNAVTTIANLLPLLD